MFRFVEKFTGLERFNFVVDDYVPRKDYVPIRFIFEENRFNGFKQDPMLTFLL